MKDRNENRLGYEKTRVGWVPEEWEVVNFRKACTTIMDGTHFSPQSKVGPYRYITSRNIRSGYLDLSVCHFVSEEEHSAIYSRCPVKKGQLLLTKDGASTGNACLNLLNEPFSLLSSVAVLDGKKDLLLNDYALQWILSPHGQFLIRNEMAGQAITRLTLQTIGLLELPLPPVPEQKKIAEILSAWDEAIEHSRKLIEAKMRRKKALMQQLLTGKKRLSGFNEPWQEHPLGNLFDERIETAYHHLPLLAITGSRGVILASEVERKDSSTSDKSKYKRIVPGDIGYNTMRMWQGVSAISSLEGIVSPAYTVCIPKKGIDAWFMGYLFKFPPVVHLFRRYSQGLVSDTLNLKFSNFAKIRVIVPGLDEQRLIREVLTTVDEEIKTLEMKLSALEKQKRGLMQKLLTGEVRVKV